jgi:hypothetical protein
VIYLNHQKEKEIHSMKVTVYGTKQVEEVVEIDDAFKILGEGNELSDRELWDFEENLRRDIKDKLGYDLEISGVWTDDDIILYED